MKVEFDLSVPLLIKVVFVEFLSFFWAVLSIAILSTLTIGISEGQNIRVYEVFMVCLTYRLYATWGYRKAQELIDHFNATF